MKILSSMKNVLRSSLIAAIVVSTGAFQLSGSSSAVTVGGGQDCDANAVIYCGAQSTETLISKYTNGTAQNSAKSIHDIYDKFGISAGAVQTMNTTAVAGKVTKTGEVYVNSSATAVANNALTAGRQNMAGSTQVNQNGTVFYTRAPGVSFRSTSIPAFVVMKDGVFQYAVISSCANPVTATPTTTPPPPTPVTTPNYNVEKQVAKKGSTDFSKAITVASGDKVTYKVTVKSTGSAAVTNLNVKDVLPAHVTYVPNTLTRDGTAVTGTEFFSTGVNVASLAAGATTTFTFDATIASDETAATCTKETLNNVGTIHATNLPEASSNAEVAKECASAPTCDAFDIVAGENRNIRVTKFEYTAKDATFVNAVINWDVNKSNEKSAAITDATKVVGQTHQYTADGTYLVSVTVTFTQNGQTVTATGVQCQKQVAFTTAPPVVTPPVKPAATLVNTGAGSTAAMFAAVTALAAGVYHWSLRRRLSL